MSFKSLGNRSPTSELDQLLSKTSKSLQGKPEEIAEIRTQLAKTNARLATYYENRVALEKPRVSKLASYQQRIREILGEDFNK